MRETEGGRHSAQAVGGAAGEHRNVPGNEALPQGQGAVVLQEVQVTQDMTDVNRNKYRTIKTWDTSRRCFLRYTESKLILDQPRSRRLLSMEVSRNFKGN